MKKIFYTLIVFTILFQSCIKSPYPEGYLWKGYAIGAAERDGNTSFILTDDEFALKIMIKNWDFPDSIVGVRLYAEGNIYVGKNGYDYGLEIGNCVIVPIKEAQTVENQGVIDLQNNAGIVFDKNEVFQTGKYLNVLLKYLSSKEKSKKHSFDFLINGATERYENNTVTINICHNTNGDNVIEQGNQVLYSLDLTNLFDKFSSDFEIKFVYTENKQTKEVILKIQNFNKN